MTWICGVFRVPRSKVYNHLTQSAKATPGAKRGPKTALSDEKFLVEIRSVIRESSFYGEGHRKVTARVRTRGFRLGKNREWLIERPSHQTPTEARRQLWEQAG